MTTEFTIQQAAKITGLTDHTLRYYERIGLILDQRRNTSGYRVYGDVDLEYISFLRQLKATGMPLAQMQQFAQLRRAGDHTAAERRHLLEVHRRTVKQQMADLNACLAMIDYKIERQREKEQQHEQQHPSRPTSTGQP